MATPITPESTNSIMAFFEHPIMTWNFFLTLILVPTVGWLAAFFVKRYMSKTDESNTVRHTALIESIRHTDEMQEERVKLITANVSNLKASVDEFCKTNTTEHEQVWRHHFHHKHTEDGAVTYTGAA